MTYPEPGDFTGTAFISCLIAGVIGKDEFEKLSSMMSAEDATEEGRSRHCRARPRLSAFDSTPYLWKEGATFPADASTVATMYADGELVLNMGYGAPRGSRRTPATLPESTRSFILDTGTVGNSNFMAVAANAPHKAAALVGYQRGGLARDAAVQSTRTSATSRVLDMSEAARRAKAPAFAESVPLGVHPDSP